MLWGLWVMVWHIHRKGNDGIKSQAFQIRWCGLLYPHPTVDTTVLSCRQWLSENILQLRGHTLTNKVSYRRQKQTHAELTPMSQQIRQTTLVIARPNSQIRNTEIKIRWTEFETPSFSDWPPSRRPASTREQYARNLTRLVGRILVCTMSSRHAGGGGASAYRWGKSSVPLDFDLKSWHFENKVREHPLLMLCLTTANYMWDFNKICNDASKNLHKTNENKYSTK